MTQPAIASRPRAEETREKLLAAAERLFAIHGIEGASIRQIVREAGQRNTAALQYHFGSKRALIEAILEWRMPEIDRHRLRMLDAIIADGREGDLRALVAAIIVPFAESVRNRTETNYYNRFMAEIQRSGEFTILEVTSEKYARGVNLATGFVVRQLADLPQRLIRQRLASFTSLVAAGVADIETVMDRRLAAGRGFDVERAVANLIDMGTAALAAPPSEETLALLQER